MPSLFSGFCHLYEDERPAALEVESSLYVGRNTESFRVAVVQFKARVSPHFISCGNQVQLVIIINKGMTPQNCFILKLQQCKSECQD